MKQIILVLLLLPVFWLSVGRLPACGQQTNSQNYVISRTYKQAGANANDVSKVVTQVQYIDGLGRPLQSVTVGQSPAGTDIVIPMAYDVLGRQPRQYLPYVAGGNGSYKSTGITDVGTWYLANSAGLQAGSPTTADLDRPFSETVFEPSPLDRPSTQQGAGTRSRSSSIAYKVNSANEVKQYDYVPATNSISTPGEYAAGTLKRTTFKDEQDYETNEYTDLLGQMVCKSVLTGSSATPAETLYTYYVYDDMGLLRGVLQPNFQDDGSLANSAFLYDYDERRRIIRKQVPGAGIIETVYDQYDRPVYSRDANQLARGVWGFTKYDELNRHVVTGEISSAATRVALAGSVDTGTGNHENRDNAAVGGYSLNLTSPTNATEANLLTITFYDDYAFSKPAGFTYVAEAGYPSAENTAVKSLVTGGRAKMLPGDGSTGGWLTNVTYYDGEYRPIQIVRELYDLGADAKERVSTQYKYDLAAVVAQQKTAQTVGGVTHTHIEENTYDHADRLLSVKETVTVGAKTKTAYTLAQRYNTLGQLQSKWFHGYAANPSKYRRRTTYTNNIRGWLTDAKTWYQQTVGTDLPFYAFSLSYNNALYGQQYSNGNISKMEWLGKDQAAFSAGLSFTYDKANRLLSAVKPVSATYPYVDTESGITYDKNGNIKTLLRAGAAVDNLSYDYTGNRLSAVSDGSGNNSGVKSGASSYAYDGNGNMTSDGNRGATLSYNYLNLPKTVTVGGKNFQYDYDADGNKHKYAGDTVNIKYAGRFEYNSGNVLKRVATSEGQLVPSGDTLRFDYFLKDHLGNVHLVWDESGKILQVSDYYAGGLSIDRDNPVTTQAARNNTNRLLYNSKELQVGSGYVDYGARMFMPELVRWGVVDPLSEISGNMSPYVYGNNNPVLMVDPTGMVARYNWSTGKYEDGGNEVSFESALSSVSGCPPNCPKNQAKSDATQVANTATSQIADGSIQLPQGEQGFIKNADSKLLPHEQQTIDGLVVALQAGYSEALLTKAISSIWALRAARTGANFAEGSFSVFNWKGYPASGIKPTGSFRLLEGAEYTSARNLANSTNAAMRKANPEMFRGLQIHEIHPVKFGGSPTDLSNKIFLTPSQHAQYTNFWNALMRSTK